MTAVQTEMVVSRRIDRIDRRILRLLQDSGRLSTKDLSKQVHLSSTPCHRRIDILEKMGVIEGYKAVLDAEQLGYSVRAFIQVTRHKDAPRDEVWSKLLSIPEVIACHVVSGEADLLLEVVARDMQHYGQIFLDQISKIEGVSDSRSLFSIKALKVNGAIPISDENPRGTTARPR